MEATLFKDEPEMKTKKPAMKTIDDLHHFAVKLSSIGFWLDVTHNRGFGWHVVIRPYDDQRYDEWTDCPSGCDHDSLAKAVKAAYQMIPAKYRCEEDPSTKG